MTDDIIEQAEQILRRARMTDVALPLALEHSTPEQALLIYQICETLALFGLTFGDFLRKDLGDLLPLDALNWIVEAFTELENELCWSDHVMTELDL